MSQEDKVTENVKSIPDKYNITYIIFFVAGVGCLLPWNFFCTAIPYFQYKLRNTSVDNSTIIAPDHMSYEQILFGNYLALCSMLPLAAFTILNLFIMKWVSAFTRYVVGSITIFLMFVLTVILIRIELSTCWRTRCSCTNRKPCWSFQLYNKCICLLSYCSGYSRYIHNNDFDAETKHRQLEAALNGMGKFPPASQVRRFWGFPTLWPTLLVNDTDALYLPTLSLTGTSKV
ncbi:Equilibrative nucleoside transporter 2 [Clonorchis sinensis]|uniref:Equilibrative nucleoside transporter 2 n=1 Tax=Clonorchis sinensis TaxID=79923 RepID=A0A8T1MX07_CLOSI|nr:Equilibrative nucleoside transporter 2 [Clonorchis sinensis]